MIGMLTTIALILLMLLNGSVAEQKIKRLDNVHCGVPHETVVAVDPSSHRYYPFFVKLHRCAGSLSPHIRHCVPNVYQELNIEVFSVSNGDKSTLTVTNHTQCKPSCIRSADDCNFSKEDWDDSLCSCKCRYPDGPPKELACKKNFRWNRNTCKCECAKAPDVCPLRMTWSHDICDCKCLDSVVDECTEAKMGIDVNCKCVQVLPVGKPEDGAKTHYHMFITLLIGQTVIIIVLICALVHWVRKRSRQNSDHSPLDRLDSSKTDETYEIDQHYLKVTVESESTDCLRETGYVSSDNVSRTASSPPLNRETNL